MKSKFRNLSVENLEYFKYKCYLSAKGRNKFYDDPYQTYLITCPLRTFSGITLWVQIWWHKFRGALEYFLKRRSEMRTIVTCAVPNSVIYSDFRTKKPAF